MFKKAEVEIEGMSDLLMDRMDPKVLLETITKKGLKQQDLVEMAKKSRYVAEVDGKEILCIETRAIRACILNMARYFKSGKYAMVQLLAGTMRIEPLSGQTREIHSGYDCIPLNKDGGYIGAEDYEVDIRAVGKKPKVLKGRAKVWPWKVKFYLVAEEELLTEHREKVEEIISGAGVVFGLLSYAPRSKGTFGRFKLGKLEILDE